MKISFSEKTVENKADRLWRVHLAGKELARRPKVRGEVAEVWLGHITSLFRITPHLLSVFDKLYRFVEEGRGRRIALWPCVRREILVAANLVWLTSARLDPPTIRQVDVGDSTDFGYALMTMDADRTVTRRALKFREKWRYAPMPEPLRHAVMSGSSVDINGALSALGGGEYDKEIAAVEGELALGHAGHVRAGLGLTTEYSKWLQECLKEGSWLRTSAIRAELRAKRRQRIDVEVPALVEPLPDSLTSEENYKLLWARPWRRAGERITIKEGRVALSSLARTARVASLQGCRKLTLCDNLGVVSAFEKGRSGSTVLNRLCRRAAAFQAGCSIRWRLRHVETARNAADTPSRWFEEPCRKSVQGGKVQVRLERFLEQEKSRAPLPPGLTEPPGADHFGGAGPRGAPEARPTQGSERRKLFCAPLWAALPTAGRETWVLLGAFQW